jgi:hypothetical protein
LRLGILWFRFISVCHCVSGRGRIFAFVWSHSVLAGVDAIPVILSLWSPICSVTAGTETEEWAGILGGGRRLNAAGAAGGMCWFFAHMPGACGLGSQATPACTTFLFSAVEPGVCDCSGDWFTGGCCWRRVPPGVPFSFGSAFPSPDLVAVQFSRVRNGQDHRCYATYVLVYHRFILPAYHH